MRPLARLPFLLLPVLLALLPAPARAADIHWTNPAGGSWSVATNWTPATVPTASDTAVFDLAGTYTVTLNVNVVLAGLRVNGAASGTQTLSAATRTVTLNGPTEIGPQGAFVLSSSTVNGTGAFMNRGALTLTASTVSNALTNAGTLLVTNTTGVNGAFLNDVGGTLRISSDLSASTQLTVANGFTNHGTIEMIALYGATGVRNTNLVLTAGTLVNSPTGVIRTLVGNGAVARGITGPIDNQGLIDVQYATSIALNRTGSSNTGTIQLNGGDLGLTVSGTTPSFTTSGALNVPTGRTLSFIGSVAGGTGQNFNFNGGTLSGAGTIALSNATLVLNSAYNSANVTLAPNTSLVNGPSTLTVGSPSTLTATSSTINAPVTVAAGGTLVLSSSTLNGACVNQGTVTLSNGTQAGTLDNFGLLSATGTSTSSGAITSRLGSTVRVYSDVTANGQLTFANGFTNNGTLELIGLYGTTGIRNTNLVLTAGSLLNTSTGVIRSLAGNGAAARGITGPIDNQGLIDVQYATSIALNRTGTSNAGTIQLTGGDLTLTVSGTTPSFTSSGTINVPTGRTLNLTGSVAGGAGQNFTYAGGTLGGRGTVTLTNATLALGSACALDSLTVNLNSSLLNGPAALTVANGARLVGSSATLNAAVVVGATGNVSLTNGTQAGALDNAGTVTFEGTVASNGAFTNRSGATFRVQAIPSSNTALTFANGFTNDGLFELTSATGTSTLRTVTVASTTGGITNNSTGTLRSAVGAGGGRTLSVALANAGLLDVKQSLSLTKAGATHTNTGTITLATGQILSLTGTTLANAAAGVLQGSGTLSLATGMTLSQAGIVRPGASPGLLRIEGRVVNTPTASWEIEVAGDAPGAGYDVLSLRDSVTIAGTLSITVGSPYLPQPGRRYTIARFASRSGSSFATVSGLAYGPGQLWALTYSDTNLVLECVDQVWTRVHPDGTPPVARAGHTAVYDSTSDRMIVFAGRSDTGVLNDVWVLTKAIGFNYPAWTRLTPTGTAPTARTNATAVYDAATNRMIIHGGEDGASPAAALADTWVLTNANGLGGTPAWLEITPASAPPARTVHAAAYDRVNNRMIVFGGRTVPGDCLTSIADVWVLSNANGLGGTPNWSALTPAGSGPSARSHAGAAWDAPTGRLIVTGGDACGSGDLGTWTLANGNGLGGTPEWTALTPSRLPATGWTLARFVYDAEYRWMDGFGGSVGGAYVDTSYTLSPADGSGASAWYGRNFYGTRPTPRAFHSMILAPATHTAVVFGGITAAGRSREVWRRQLDRAPVLDADGPPPTLRPNRTAFSLPPAPNPTSGAVRMAVDLARDQHLTLAIFDVTGRQVALLHQGILPAGRHSFDWSGQGAAGGRARPGVYLVRMEAEDARQTTRLVRLD